jgi:hypothetical protein
MVERMRSPEACGPSGQLARVQTLCTRELQIDENPGIGRGAPGSFSGIRASEAV